MIRICRHCLVGNCPYKNRNSKNINITDSSIDITFEYDVIDNGREKINIMHLPAEIMNVDPKTIDFAKDYFERKKSKKKDTGIPLQTLRHSFDEDHHFHQTLVDKAGPKLYRPKGDFNQPKKNYPRNTSHEEHHAHVGKPHYYDKQYHTKRDFHQRKNKPVYDESDREPSYRFTQQNTKQEKHKPHVNDDVIEEPYFPKQDIQQMCRRPKEQQQHHMRNLKSNGNTTKRYISLNDKHQEPIKENNKRTYEY